MHIQKHMAFGHKQNLTNMYFDPFIFNSNNCLHLIVLGRDSVVIIATRYLLEGLGFEPWWRSDLPHPSRPDDFSIVTTLFGCLGTL
jgi:hypothetical protein